MANQVDFKILPSDQFNVYSPQTRSDKIITYFTLLSKLRGDILAVGQAEDPNNIVSAYYSSIGGSQTLHLVKADGSEVTASNSYAGTVTSVDMSVPTGFAISGNPITTIGTLNLAFASGYSLPTNAIQADWTTAYNNSIVSAAVTGTSTKTLTLNQQDAGTITANWTDLGLTSVGLTMPAAFSVANSPLTADGTIAVTAAGLSSQYIRGDGQLANFPSSAGGGSSVNYYLNGSVNQGTFGGVTYYELSRTPIAGAGTNFTRLHGSGDGYVASFITDAGDPDLINIPGGNWNLEFFFNSSSNGGNPSFYGELYKVSASNVFTLIASASTNPEGITGGTTVDQYYTSIAVPQTSLLSTDRIAIRVYIITSGRNITLHTENSNFSEVITTFSTGLNALNGLTDQVQYFAVGTSGTDFNISSASDTHTFNIPTSSATNRGALSSADWTTFNNKASDAFKTIAVAGQSDVVADTATDTLTLVAGTNVTITTNASTDTITINSTDQYAGTVTSVAALTIGTTGTDLSSTVANSTTTPVITLNVPTASAANRGALSSTDWSTFNAKEPAVTKGNLTETTSSVLTITGGTNAVIGTGTTIAVSQATASTSGYLSSTDWNTFNSKAGLSFSTIAVSGQSNIVADSASDTLNVAAGTGVTLTTVAGTDTLTITNSAPDQTVALTAGTGISTSGTYPNFTITNSAPDQTVVLTAGTGITTSGTYPSFTITNSAPDQTVVLTAGAGITTSGTYPSFIVTNAAPDQTVVLTAGTGITTSGTYPNFTVTNAAPDQTVALTAGTGISVSGTYPNFTITNSSPSSGGTVTSIATTAPITGGTITATGTIGITQSGAASDGYLSSTNWNTFNGKQNTITLTTTGSSGAATFISNTLNVPEYTLSGLGGVPTTRTLTINGTALDLSANRSWSVGTVTSVGLTAGARIDVSGGPITSSGSITVTHGTASGADFITAQDFEARVLADGGIFEALGEVAIAIGSLSDAASPSSTDYNDGIVIQNVAVDTYGHLLGVGVTDLDDRYVQNLTAGTGISVSGTPSSTAGLITVNNSDRGSSQNIFKNVAVAGQSTIVADSNDDTLTVAAGTGISITTSAGTDTLTITNTQPANSRASTDSIAVKASTAYTVVTPFDTVIIDSITIEALAPGNVDDNNKMMAIVTLEVQNTSVIGFVGFTLRLYNDTDAANVSGAQIRWSAYMYPSASEFGYTSFTYHIPIDDNNVDNGDVIQLQLQLEVGTCDINIANFTLVGITK